MFPKFGQQKLTSVRFLERCGSKLVEPQSDIRGLFLLWIFYNSKTCDIKIAHLITQILTVEALEYEINLIT